MVYKFKSAVTGDLIMLGPQGDQLLRLLGREPAAQGIIEHAAMGSAIEMLQRAIAEAQAAGSAAGDDGEAPGGGRDARAVSLRQRLWPMLEMLKRAQAGKADIVWGV